MFPNFQTNTDISQFFGSNGNGVTSRTNVDTGENGQSWYQEEHTSSTTESGTPVFEKSETDEFFEELEKFISASDDYGDSDTDGTSRSFERRATPSHDVGIANNKIVELGQDEHREKSPGFGDFFLN
ncbi:uncharacterized protein LOC132923751 [Rhopalosiphum padi]|uniref:uncharacterized protein LOC132923751 n=1 Tax=Rhopalosiphum padi TaxID=40932 RepID=UPI00298E9199|nr:uncharacterized protein LOC132923751 [Rhopalosiphum padi]